MVVFLERPYISGQNGSTFEYFGQKVRKLLKISSMGVRIEKMRKPGETNVVIAFVKHAIELI